MVIYLCSRPLHIPWLHTLKNKCCLFMLHNDWWESFNRTRTAAGVLYAQSYMHMVLVSFGLFWLYTRVVVVSFDLFTEVYQSCLIGIMSILRLSWCQWSNPKGHGSNRFTKTTAKCNRVQIALIILGMYCKLHTTNSQDLMGTYFRCYRAISGGRNIEWLLCVQSMAEVNGTTAEVWEFHPGFYWACDFLSILG